MTGRLAPATGAGKPATTAAFRQQPDEILWFWRSWARACRRRDILSVELAACDHVDLPDGVCPPRLAAQRSETHRARCRRRRRRVRRRLRGEEYRLTMAELSYKLYGGIGSFGAAHAAIRAKPNRDRYYGWG
jgi:hypothetical protein